MYNLVMAMAEQEKRPEIQSHGMSHCCHSMSPSRLFGWERLCTTVCAYAYDVSAISFGKV